MIHDPQHDPRTYTHKASQPHPSEEGKKRKFKPNEPKKNNFHFEDLIFISLIDPLTFVVVYLIMFRPFG